MSVHHCVSGFMLEERFPRSGCAPAQDCHRICISAVCILDLRNGTKGETIEGAHADKSSLVVFMLLQSTWEMPL